MPIKDIPLTLTACLPLRLGSATARSAQSPYREPRFALEMRGGETQPTCFLVPADPDISPLTTFFNTALVPLAAENTTSNGQDNPSTLGFDVKADGQAISISAFP